MMTIPASMYPAILPEKDEQGYRNETSLPGLNDLHVADEGGLPFARVLNLLPGIKDLAIPTNGILLPRLGEQLRMAGVRRLNITGYPIRSCIEKQRAAETLIRCG
jgi:hypothetical protein